MLADDPRMGDSTKSDQPATVADRVLTAFVDAVAEESDLAEVAERLRKTLFVERNLSDAALRTALFGGDQS